MGAEHIDVRHLTYEGRHVVFVDAGIPTVERVVPPAGEDYAFDRRHWPLRVEVCVSPTGRSARVWVNGTEVTR